MTAYRRNFEGTMIRGHHYSEEFNNSKYEVNRTTKLTLLSEIDIRESGDCYSSVRSKNVICEEKNDLNITDSKPSLWHPVTLLYQICNDNKCPSPNYQLISEESSIKKNVFTYEVKALQNSAVGFGVTKREAKRAASQALLHKLKGSPYLQNYHCAILSQPSILVGDSVITSDDSNAVDAISELNNLCISQKWPFPVYALLSTSGSLHNRMFTLGCTILGHPELGEGTAPTKKEAKRAASQALLEKINYPKPYTNSISTSKNPLCIEENQANCPDFSENAVSLLNEICNCYNWPLPIYEFISESGPHKRKLFTVGCTVLGHTELGMGLTKVEAKHTASLAILIRIREYLEESVPFLNKPSNHGRRKRSCSPHPEKKDAISNLHEICASLNWPHPTYEVLSEEGPPNSRVFTVGCFVMGHTSLVKGAGHSKREAKHAASQAMLEIMKKNEDGITLSVKLHSESCICEEEDENSCPHKLPVNATSLLNEMCMCYKWPHPTYEYLPEKISMKRKLFVVECSLLNNTEAGTGYTKREAKHAASLAILVKMRSFVEIPLLDIRKENSASNEVKDPTTILHEFCASRSWCYPTYEVLSEEGPSNLKTFIIACVVPGQTDMVKGTGRRKIEAKHEASQALLDLLNQHAEENGVTKNRILNMKDKSTNKVTKDPISTLHEICASRNWPYPIYAVSEEGPPNNRLFTFTCVVSGHTSSVQGTGRSKNEAKREASLVLLDRIEQQK